MGHHITIVDDDALPEGHDFVFVNLPDGAHIFYRRSTLDVGPLEDSWAAFRALTTDKPRTPTRCCAEPGVLLDLERRAG